MNYVDILVSIACGLLGSLVLSIALCGGFALSVYRLKVNVTDLQQRVLQLYNRNANQASQAKQRLKPEDLEELMKVSRPRTQRFSNDPLEYDFNAPKDRG